MLWDRTEVILNQIGPAPGPGAVLALINTLVLWLTVKDSWVITDSLLYIITICTHNDTNIHAVTMTRLTLWLSIHFLNFHAWPPTPTNTTIRDICPVLCCIIGARSLRRLPLLSPDPSWSMEWPLINHFKCIIIIIINHHYCMNIQKVAHKVSKQTVCVTHTIHTHLTLVHVAWTLVEVWERCQTSHFWEHSVLSNFSVCRMLYEHKRTATVYTLHTHTSNFNVDRSRPMLCNSSQTVPCQITFMQLSQQQTMSHIMDACAFTKFDGGLKLLHEAEDDAVKSSGCNLWWLQYSWNEVKCDQQNYSFYFLHGEA